MSHRRTALTALVLTTTAALAATPALAAPAQPSAPTEIDVICDGIGADTVTVTGDLSRGGTAEITDGPLTVVGRPGFTGQDASGHQVRIEPSGTGATCTATTDSVSTDITKLLPATQALKAQTTGKVTGRLTFTVEVDDTPPPAAQRSAEPYAAAASLPFESELRSYLNSRPGAVGVAVRVPGSGRSWTYTKTSSRNVTASIVKVHIMSAVMMKAQDAGRGLTSWEKSQIVPMIRNSDNNATTALFNHIGGRSGLDRAADRLGLDQTYADPYNHWGLTSTTAADQAELMEHYARPSKALSYTNRMYGLTQMRNINSSQDWGVTAGAPSGSVALKNGWLPRTDGWHVNSIGWAKVSSTDYTIAVLTHDNPGAMSTEISTIEGVSRIVYKNRAQLKAPTPPQPDPRGRSRDFTGDGKVDLMGRNQSGRVYVHNGDGNGDFAARRSVGTGFADADWFGHAGDVNRDGRSDVLVRRGDGRLQLMLTTASGQLGTAKTIATGWDAYTDLASGGDVDGNGRLDVINRRASGSTDQYELSDSGTLRFVRRYGVPAKWYQNIELVPDVNGDGRDDLRGVSSGGRMRTWTSTGTGWTMTTKTSTGWDRYRTVAVPGDAGGADNKQGDIVAVRPDGDSLLYFAGKGGSHTNYPRDITPSMDVLPIVF